MLSLRYFKPASTAGSLESQPAITELNATSRERSDFLTRTKGIQLITASSITVSKHLTQQLMYELQQFHCSCQHQKGDTKMEIFV